MLLNQRATNCNFRSHACLFGSLSLSFQGRKTLTVRWKFLFAPTNTTKRCLRLLLCLRFLGRQSENERRDLTNVKFLHHHQAMKRAAMEEGMLVCFELSTENKSGTSLRDFSVSLFKLIRNFLRYLYGYQQIFRKKRKQN